MLDQPSRDQTRFVEQFIAQSLRSGELGGINVGVALIMIEYEENGQRYREALVSTLNHGFTQRVRGSVFRTCWRRMAKRSLLKANCSFED